MKPKIVRHIIVKYDVQPPLMVCQNCGQTRTISLPCSVNDFVHQAEGFSDSHKNCKVRT